MRRITVAWLCLILGGFSLSGCAAVAETLLNPGSFPDYSARCNDGFMTKASDPEIGCKGHGGVDQRYVSGQSPNGRLRRTRW